MKLSFGVDHLRGYRNGPCKPLTSEALAPDMRSRYLGAAERGMMPRAATRRAASTNEKPFCRKFVWLRILYSFKRRRSVFYESRTCRGSVNYSEHIPRSADFISSQNQNTPRIFIIVFYCCNIFVKYVTFSNQQEHHSIENCFYKITRFITKSRYI